MKVSLSREECFLATRTRHAFTIDGQMGVNRDGTLKGYSLDVLSNTGAYAHLRALHRFCRGNKVAYLYPRCAYSYSSERPAIPTSPRLVRCVVMARHKSYLPLSLC
ncbi:molybdopterin-dependent oxidoreductase [Escherichia coli]|nr:molybdopterin-dependent oxidoreductase [Escherichia coli]